MLQSATICSLNSVRFVFTSSVSFITGDELLQIFVRVQLGYMNSMADVIREPLGSSPSFGEARVAHLCRVLLLLFPFCFLCYRHVFCVPNVSNVSRFSILVCCFGFP